MLGCTFIEPHLLDPTLNSNQVNLRRTNSLKCGGFRNLVPGLCEVMLYHFQKALMKQQVCHGPF